jgi:coenzyme F420-reducing hydrogenase delta subunit
MVSYDVREIRDTMAATVGPVERDRKEPVIVAFLCSHHVGIMGFELPGNVRKVPVHCTSRVDVNDMLKALECGADGVAVVRCSGGTCKYKGIDHRVSARVDRTKQLVGMLGMEPERIALLTADSGNGKSYVSVCSDFSDRIKGMGLRTR